MSNNHGVRSWAEVVRGETNLCRDHSDKSSQPTAHYDQSALGSCSRAKPNVKEKSRAGKNNERTPGTTGFGAANLNAARSNLAAVSGSYADAASPKSFIPSKYSAHNLNQDVQTFVTRRNRRRGKKGKEPSRSTPSGTTSLCSAIAQRDFEYPKAELDTLVAVDDGTEHLHYDESLVYVPSLGSGRPEFVPHRSGQRYSCPLDDGKSEPGSSCQLENGFQGRMKTSHPLYAITVKAKHTRHDAVQHNQLALPLRHQHSDKEVKDDMPNTAIHARHENTAEIASTLDCLQSQNQTRQLHLLTDIANLSTSPGPTLSSSPLDEDLPASTLQMFSNGLNLKDKSSSIKSSPQHGFTTAVSHAETLKDTTPNSVTANTRDRIRANLLKMNQQERKAKSLMHFGPKKPALKSGMQTPADTTTHPTRIRQEVTASQATPPIHPGAGAETTLTYYPHGHILGLPDEILSRICHFVLLSPDPIPIDLIFDPFPPNSRCTLDYRLIHTNRHFYDLGIELMYEQNTWAIDLKGLADYPERYREWPVGFGIDIGLRKIRRIVLMNDLDSTFMWHYAVHLLRGFLEHGGQVLPNGRHVGLRRVCFDVRSGCLKDLQGWVEEPAPQFVVQILEEAGMFRNGLLDEGVWVGGASVEDLDHKRGLPDGGFGGLRRQLEESLSMWRASKNVR